MRLPRLVPGTPVAVWWLDPHGDSTETGQPGKVPRVIRKEQLTRTVGLWVERDGDWVKIATDDYPEGGDEMRGMNRIEVHLIEKIQLLLLGQQVYSMARVGSESQKAATATRSGRKSK